MDLNTKTVDQLWSEIPLYEKRQLLKLYFTSPIPYWTQTDFDRLPDNILNCIASFLVGDPRSFFNFKFTCKRTVKAVDFYEFADKSNVAHFAFRLCRRMRSIHKVNAFVSSHCLDEHDRFKGMACYYFGNNKKEFALIDKVTGMIFRNSDKKNPRGSVFDKSPERFFKINKDTLIPETLDFKEFDKNFIRKRKAMTDIFNEEEKRWKRESSNINEQWNKSEKITSFYFQKHH